MAMSTMQKIFDLSGRVALVTGARRGLGYGMAKALAEAGADVVINSRNEALLKAAAEGLAAQGLKVTWSAFDVTQEDAVKRAMQALVDKHGKLDVMVNTVGQRDRRGMFEFALDDVRKLIDADLIAAFSVSRAAAHHMIPRKTGRIVNVTSIAGPIARAGDAAYTAAKGGLASLTRAMCAELGPHGITVNAISPGFFATETNAAMVADPEINAWVERRIALKRWGQPHEVAGACVFLASDAGSFVTGQVI
ncbi:MAG: SDR family oxidoreductase, partial [Alphaproteobacteria bacterium]|nr:SDR family oxidoreductase [Alphaproteobacteria bacterium]